jgi:hypothetical protein
MRLFGELVVGATCPLEKEKEKKKQGQSSVAFPVSEKSDPGVP